MRIFVYGSLRRKQGNSHWMTNAQWLGDYALKIINCTVWGTIQALYRAKAGTG
jgi:gamma-glutamylcyclotransferase (GGCT)/AIG2-like uncharacterized protein YtfP